MADDRRPGDPERPCTVGVPCPGSEDLPELWDVGVEG